MTIIKGNEYAVVSIFITDANHCNFLSRNEHSHSILSLPLSACHYLPTETHPDQHTYKRTAKASVCACVRVHEREREKEKKRRADRQMVTLTLVLEETRIQQDYATPEHTAKHNLLSSPQNWHISLLRPHHLVISPASC